MKNNDELIDRIFMIALIAITICLAVLFAGELILVAQLMLS